MRKAIKNTASGGSVNLLAFIAIFWCISRTDTFESLHKKPLET